MKEYIEKVSDILQNIADQAQVMHFNHEYATDFALRPLNKDNWMCVKVVKQNKSGCVRLKDSWVSQHIHIILNHDNSEMILLSDRSSLRDIPKFDTIKKHSAVYDDTNVCNSLRELLETALLVPLQSIAPYRLRPTGNMLFVPESRTHVFLTSILGIANWQKTRESCRADGAILHRHQQALGVQIKTTTIISGRYRKVAWTMSSYEGMLCILHCTATDHLIIIPGSLIKDVTGVCIYLDENSNIKADSKYGKFEVKSSCLSSFVNELLNAVTAQQTKVMWPTGYEVDVNSLSMKSFDEWDTPQGLSRSTENIHVTLRQKTFPDIAFALPQVDAAHYDVTVQNKTIQDKTAWYESRYNKWVVPLRKADGQRKKQPYHENDFDFLWVHIDARWFYLFPASVLASMGMLSGTGTKGKQTFRICLQDEHSWTNPYKLSLSADTQRDLLNRINASG